MKKILRNFFAAAVTLFAVGMVQNSYATHVQGGDMTYISVAPGIYTVNLKIYRDCSGIVAPTTASLKISSPGCNSGRNITMTKVGNNRIGSPYCASIPVQCTATGRTNYEEVIFSSTVIFSAAEQACNNWVLTWSECCRPSSANLVGQDNPWQEAMINLAAGINNNSPQFGALNVPVPYVNYNKPIQISLNAFESDEDSLVYTLVDPLYGNNSVIPKQSYPAAMIYNSDSTKYALAPAGSYTSTFPIFSFDADWSLPMPITPVKKFIFDTKTGSMSFIPNLYNPTAPSNQGKDKYVLVVQIDEYRKINNSWTRVGYIRRDMMINVMDCGPNQNPNITAPVVNGQPIAETDVIHLRPGTPMNMQFATQDANATDALIIESDVAQVLPGATLTASTGNKPTVTVNWTPTANHVSGRTYYFHVTVQDNACPVKGYSTHTYGVRVSATGGVTSVNEISVAGNGFSVFPNPYTNDLHFKLNLKTKAESIKIYNVLGQQIDQITLKSAQNGEQNLAWKNAGKYAAGTYVAKLVSSDKTVQTLKFTKLQ